MKYKRKEGKKERNRETERRKEKGVPQANGSMQHDAQSVVHGARSVMECDIWHHTMITIIGQNLGMSASIERQQQVSHAHLPLPERLIKTQDLGVKVEEGAITACHFIGAPTTFNSTAHQRRTLHRTALQGECIPLSGKHVRLATPYAPQGLSPQSHSTSQDPCIALPAGCCGVCSGAW